VSGCPWRHEPKRMAAWPRARRGAHTKGYGACARLERRRRDGVAVLGGVGEDERVQVRT